MTAGSARIAVLWAAKARADLRAIERETALQILYCMDRYLTSRSGEEAKTPVRGLSSSLRQSSDFL